MSNSQLEIANVCDQIKDLLLSKNAKYGDSALNPSRIFSSASPVEQLLVRIDDKLNRIQKGAGLLASDEDVVNDLIGYLVLLKIALGRNQENSQSSYKDIVTGLSSNSTGYWPNDPWDGLDIDNPYDFLHIQTVRSPD
ncbi:MAG: hypothetical protein ACO4CS_19815 [bacterium]